MNSLFFQKEFSFFKKNSLFSKRILFFQKEFSFSKKRSLFPKRILFFQILFFQKEFSFSKFSFSKFSFSKFSFSKKNSLFVQKDRPSEELNPADVYFGLFYVFSSKKGRFLRQLCVFEAFVKPSLLRFLQTMMIIFAGEITTTKSVCVGTIHEYINSRTSSP
jgi:hypothetical protein